MASGNRRAVWGGRRFPSPWRQRGRARRREGGGARGERSRSRRDPVKDGPPGKVRSISRKVRSIKDCRRAIRSQMGKYMYFELIKIQIVP
jgi:hypothetical protein